VKPTVPEKKKKEKYPPAQTNRLLCEERKREGKSDMPKRYIFTA